MPFPEHRHTTPVSLSAKDAVFPSFSSAEYASLFGLFATSEAVASISMADQMNGDSELAGQILVWTTVFSSLTLFLFVAFFRHIGIF